MYCPQCGTDNVEDAKFCAKCGRNLQGESNKSQSEPVGKTVQTEPKKLYRCSNNKSVGGVCSGLAKYADMDVDTVRLITVLTFLVTGSATFWVYLILWAVLPEEPC